MATADSRSILASDLWARTGEDTLSRNAFLGLTGALTLYGLALNAGLAWWTLQAGWRPGLFGMIGLGLVLPLVGVVVAGRARTMAMSLVGYHLLLVPFGLILGPILEGYLRTGGTMLVMRALMLTGCTTGVMTLLGLSYPKVFEKLGGVLFASLIALVVLRLVGMFVALLGAAGWIEWLAAGIFTLYIGFDCHRAMAIPATGRNAVDVAVSLYLDIFNLFLTILRILSPRD